MNSNVSSFVYGKFTHCHGYYSFELTLNSKKIMDKNVLVLCATSKQGRNVCRSLVANGFKVYGTSRSSKNTLASDGVNVVICDYTKKESLTSALDSTGCKQIYFFTDFQTVGNVIQKEIDLGKMIVDTCKEKACQLVVYSSAYCMDKYVGKYDCRLAPGKLAIEQYLIESTIPAVAIVRPAGFFENFDDPAHYNPLKKGSVKGLSDKKWNYCSTYDIGSAMAEILNNPSTWNRKIVNIVAWSGTIADVAAALQNVSKVPTKASLSLPKFIQWLFIYDIYRYTLFVDDGCPGVDVDADIAAFKQMVPNAMNAEDWFKYRATYSNGEPIVPA